MISSTSLRILVLLSLFLLPGWARAESFPKPGTYMLYADEGLDDGGDLTIEKNKDGTLAFSIDTMNSNGYTCSPKGIIHRGQAILKTDELEDCIITFKKGKKGSILVEVTTPPSCRAFCGARGYFEGVYHPY